MSRTQQESDIDPERVRELAEKARQDDKPNLADWLEECARKEEQTDG